MTSTKVHPDEPANKSGGSKRIYLAVAIIFSLIAVSSAPSAPCLDVMAKRLTL